MNEARTVLFALSSAGVSPQNTKAFEDKTMVAIRAGSKDYYNSNSVHCDYKDGLLKMCGQYKPSAVIINELLTGNGNIFEIAKEIKSDYPNTTVILLLKDNRPVGDAVLADLVSSGIYDWVSAPWRTDQVANMVVSPRKRKDVEIYRPKIVEGANGLAFETKTIQKRIEDDLDAIDNTVFTPENRALSVDEEINPLNQTEEIPEVDYHQVIGRRHSFGFGRPKGKGLGINLSLNSSTVEIPKEEPKEEIKAPEISTLIQKNVSEVAKPVIEAIKQAEKVEPVLHASKEELLNKMSKFNKANKVEEPKVKQLAISEDKIEALKKVLKEDSPKQPTFDARVKPAETEKKANVKKQINTLADIEFIPKYKKVLFVRALPLSTVFPLHLAKMSNAAFVDFNKESCYDGFEDVYKTTFKEAKMPDTECVVADAVAGNGIEKIAKYFDHIIAIIPEDYFVIKTFLKRYPDLTKTFILQNSEKLINFKEVKDLFPNGLDKMYFLNEKTLAVANALQNKTMLMDNSEYSKNVNYIIKNLNEK